MSLNTRQVLFIYSIVVAVMLVSLCIFYFVWLKHYSSQAHSSHRASFSTLGSLSQLHFNSEQANIHIAHFVNRGCPCTRFSLPYIDTLKKELTAGVEHLIVDANLVKTPLAEPLRRLLTILPASPAVAIWDKAGKLVYYGPYSTGAYCGDGEDMVRYILTALDKGESPQWVNQEALGCMCDWPSSR